jgi:apolipoprotein N-acyltransferase
VPFGEFVPTGFHWFVNMLGIPMSDQTPGKAWQRAWQVKDQAVLPNICFEDLFGEEIAHHMQAAAANGAATPSILLNVSNLAWFDDSLALPQHLQIAQMRAIETARPMLRATNTGATAIILPDGTVQVQQPFLQQNSISAKVQGMQGLTPYVRFGNGIMLVLAGLALAAAWVLRKRLSK